MRNQNKENKNQTKSLSENKPGYGDKKLEGPNRPSTWFYHYIFMMDCLMYST